MFNYLLTYRNQIPNNIGFGQFSVTHISVVIVALMWIWYFAKQYRAADTYKKIIYRRRLALTIVVLEVAKEGYLALTGQFQPELLPFHLCGMSIFICAIDAFWARDKINQTTRQILYCLTLPGAAMAILFPDWAEYPIMNVFAWQSFIIHTLLIAYAFILLKSGELVPDFRQLWRPVGFLAAVVPFVLFINAKLGTNFYFLNTSAPGSPLEILQTTFGNYYVLSMILMVALAWFFMYIPWEIKKHRDWKRQFNAVLFYENNV
ncbi:TIGR02206 family membrane protein [Periweissella cryptocerci]|uniref:TIGR02206 family membrane protein n=1 Tax=Periweissella cryptocerci TaxID=2506420 RepID=A0A4V1AIP4_9LACO|nr:TIGR02206 family membrane protein [Periweissella cryptocerci]QBO36215.1 TIGR02206 family membrane protein [Periweissella cryptocerci]